MNNLQTIHQKPRPRIRILDRNGKEIITFNVFLNNEVQSYSFSYSRESVDGNFNVTFYPESKTGKSYIDLINIMDIVQIYEDSAESMSNKPVFTGVIKNKKFVGQMSENGLTKRLSISGIGITGLVSQFYVNLDTKACVLTESLAQNAEITKALTLKIKNETDIKDIVRLVWEHFVDISTKYADVATIDIKDLLDKFIGDPDDIFTYDEALPIKYPVGCIFNGESTQDFYSVIDGIIPTPYYEKFAYFNAADGKQKIKIRISPFSPAKWKRIKTKKITPVEIKNISVEQSDSEVYTAFYAYIANSPIEEDKEQLISTQLTGSSAADIDKDKFKMYGYRLLSAHFLGYVKSESETDTGTSSYLKSVIADLRNWYGKIDEMFSGNITTVTKFGMKPEEFINPGDVISVFGAQFYVDGVTHNWSYGQGGETNISVSRGGKYVDGEFSRITDISNNMTLLEKGIA